MSASIVAATGFTAEEGQDRVPKTQLTLDARVPSSAPGTCQSRSTSAGSETPPQSSVGEENAQSPFLSLAKALEDPFENMDRSPFPIRNTFYDAPVGRPLSLEGFFSERAIQSCPPSRLVSFDDVKAPPGLDDVTAPPGLENVGRAKLDKSVRAIPSEQDPLFVIRNTFIDTASQRPLSLEGFITEREAQSCPASRNQSFDDAVLPPGLEALLESMNETGPLSPRRTISLDALSPPARPISIDGGELPTVADASKAGFGPFCTGAAGIPLVPPPPMSWAPMFAPCAYSPPPPPTFSPDATVLRLSQILEEPEVAPAQLPSVGSAGHHAGECKPCAFFYTKGCGNGKNCTFCHLCGPDEKKKRRAEKKMARFSAAGQSVLSYNY